jgi:hypothetical protein
MHRSPPGNAADKRVRLVQRQIVPRVFMQQRKNGVQCSDGVLGGLAGGSSVAGWVPATLRMRSGMSAGKAMMSTQPAAMALLGMESNCADSGCCASVSPPCVSQT